MRFLKLVTGLIGMLCFWPMLGAVVSLVGGRTGVATVLTSLGAAATALYLLAQFFESE